MKILHTSDWHIGQYFFGYDRKEEHLLFFNWLKKQINELQADVLLVAGDIFDSPNPSAESQKMYYKFLYEVTIENPKLQVVITAGNHDSAARLEAPNPLFENMNISVRGMVRKKKDGEIDLQHLIIPLTQNGKTVAWCMAVPYLRQGDYPKSEEHYKGIEALYGALFAELEKNREENQAIIVMGHLQASGARVSENDQSERSIVGGLEFVSPETFNSEGLIYTALGHLHRAQRVSEKENIRYSGSPLPMSFAEINYKKGIDLIEFNNLELQRIERIPLQVPTPLISLPQEHKPLHEVLKEIESLPDGEVTQSSPYLELKILITEPEPSMRHQIESALQGKSVRLARLASKIPKSEKEGRTISYEELKTTNPLDIANDFFQRKYGAEMPDNLIKMLKDVIQEVQL